MSAPIKRFSLCADDEAEADLGKGFMCENDDGGDYVLHADHLASHAYDEEKERVLFEAHQDSIGASKHRAKAGNYFEQSAQAAWLGWLACAKHRSDQNE
jgi:hypothetical protein